MEVYQSIKVYVPENQALEFKNKVIELARTIGWHNKPEFELDYNRNTMSDDVVLCIETGILQYQNKSLNAFVWMRSKKDSFDVFNIIPIKTRQLSYGEYNFIISQFYQLILKDVTRELNLDAVITSPQKLMREIIGDEAFDLLCKFSRTANRSTGNTHASDFDRWSDFILAIFRNHIELGTDELVRWLEEDEKWTNTLAWKLGLDFEYALQILEKYEQSS